MRCNDLKFQKTMVQEKMERLTGEDLKFFYGILVYYEHNAGDKDKKASYKSSITEKYPNRPSRNKLFKKYEIEVKGKVEGEIRYDNIEQEIADDNWDKNKIKMTVASNENKIIAFLRHVRNAFAHIRVYVRDDEYVMYDYDMSEKKITMYGRVDKQYIREVIEEIEPEFKMLFQDS